MESLYSNNFAVLKLCTKLEDFFSAANSSKSDCYSLLWVLEGMIEILVDEVAVSVNANQMTFITPAEYVKILENHGQVRVIQFNREFYCIWENDHEVSCDGILYFGSRGVPVINLEDTEIKSFSMLLGILQEEFEVSDTIQEEMLRTVLKRWLIKSTRILKVQSNYVETNEPKMELFKQFKILLEKNYKEYHKVSDYAKVLNKSPKTIVNQFKLLGLQNPSIIIKQRIITEAKRYLLYSPLSIKEIAFKLGFDEPSSFSHYFKTHTSFSPTHFAEKYRKN